MGWKKKILKRQEARQQDRPRTIGVLFRGGRNNSAIGIKTHNVDAGVVVDNETGTSVKDVVSTNDAPK